MITFCRTERGGFAKGRGKHKYFFWSPIEKARWVRLARSPVTSWMQWCIALFTRRPSITCKTQKDILLLIYLHSTKQTLILGNIHRGDSAWEHASLNNEAARPVYIRRSMSVCSNNLRHHIHQRHFSTVAPAVSCALVAPLPALSGVLFLASKFQQDIELNMRVNSHYL